MHDDSAVTAWVVRLKQGDTAAAEELWRRYYDRLVRLARRKLAGGRRRVADEEDVVLSAFDSFFRGAAQQRFPRLEDRHDLWQLLLLITARKASDQLQWERRGKRGAGKVRGESAFGAADERSAGLGQIIGNTPSPEFAVEVAEQCERLLAKLPDERLREIAIRKLGGETNEEIAQDLGCGVRTIERKLALIRSLWETGSPPDAR